VGGFDRDVPPEVLIKRRLLISRHGLKNLRFDALKIYEPKNGRNRKSEKATLYHTSHKPHPYNTRSCDFL
jgi:hypothetical protein